MLFEREISLLVTMQFDTHNKHPETIVTHKKKTIFILYNTINKV